MVEFNCSNCNKKSERKFLDKRVNNYFCSRSCSATYNNSRRSRHYKSQFCAQCNNEIPKNKRNNKRFCSQSCRSKHQEQERLSKILEQGYIFPKGYHKTSKTAKKYLALIKSYKCDICNIGDIWNDKKLVLILDHINGISDDWSIDNLRFVCPNCDSQLPTYKSKNNSKGRPDRIKPLYEIQSENYWTCTNPPSFSD